MKIIVSLVCTSFGPETHVSIRCGKGSMKQSEAMEKSGEKVVFIFAESGATMLSVCQRTGVPNILSGCTCDIRGRINPSLE